MFECPSIFAYILYAYTVKAHRRGVAMSCHMCTKVLLNSADIGYLLKVAVHILIARNRE